jgi:hypothetical protein
MGSQGPVPPRARIGRQHVVGPDGMSESAFIDHCRIAQNCVRYNVPWAVARHRNFILERADAAMKAEGGEITESRWREKVESVSREEAAQREVAGDLGGRPAAVDPEAILQRALQVIHHELARPEVKTALKAKSRISRAIMAIAHHVETVLVSELAQGPAVDGPPRGHPDALSRPISIRQLPDLVIQVLP